MAEPLPVAVAEPGPWNPGIQSHIPLSLRHLCTIFRDENVATSVAAATELRQLTGLPLSELVAFRPQRLLLHELLIRVTADFSVPDGSLIGDLGINFRQMVRRLLQGHLETQLAEVEGRFARSRRELAATIDVRFAEFGRDWGPPEIAGCEERARSAVSAADRSLWRALARIMTALFTTHGRAWGSRELIVSLATDLVCNTHGSDLIGQWIEPILREAAAAEGYTLLPPQERPIVINTKGPSASGKSTLRPLQKRLAGQIGVRWSDFALISPDIWRKQLLDYASLGAAFRYAGAFTSEEVQIIDQKLDRYMAAKHRRTGMAHLLIDRFRFDSFAPDSEEAGSNLLTRFGDSVYLFFVITPPASLVERAWKRGLEFGRYKAVDDTLAHAVEAYTGMPDVFFTWVTRTDKSIQIEFLDNSVSLGELPRTVAFGNNHELNVLDTVKLIDIERFGRVDVNAHSAAALYVDRAVLEPQRNVGFLRRCLTTFREVNFCDPSGRIYLWISGGKPVRVDREALRTAVADHDTFAALREVAAGAFAADIAAIDAPRYVADPGTTLGQWGHSSV